ncbi:hypothetical protein AAD018_016020 [Aestuariibius insulae]|uniref:hypothetical protein n=1 Tax=Aestuariibius insulae TaxID=2058287 RepID=UPI00345EC96F
MPNEEFRKRRHETAEQFYGWILEARKLVDEHFPSEGKSIHNQLVVETAKSLMTMHKMTEMQHSIDGLRKEIMGIEES